MAYTNASDLQLTIGQAAYLAIFDDENTGVVNQQAIDLVLTRACARVDGYLSKVYTGPLPLPDPAPPLAREAALEFAVGMAYLRSPEYARRYGEKLKVDEFERGEKLCKDLALNVQRLADPPAVEDPSNVGGGVYYGPDDDNPTGVGCGIFARGWGDFLGNVSPRFAPDDEANVRLSDAVARCNRLLRLARVVRRSDDHDISRGDLALVVCLTPLEKFWRRPGAVFVAERVAPLVTQSRMLSAVVPTKRWAGLTHGGLSHRWQTTSPLGTGPAKSS